MFIFDIYDRLLLKYISYMEIKNWVVLMCCLSVVIGFQVGVDFNTYSAQELNEAIKVFGRVDFTWAITVNSPGVST
jgi:hypothetical protein